MKNFSAGLNNFILASFLFAIIALATVTTMGLSPIVAEPVESWATNIESSGEILGLNSTENFTIEPLSASGSLRELDLDSRSYLYQETISGPVQPSRYIQDFLAVINNGHSARDLSVALRLPAEVADHIQTAIELPNGDTYKISSESRSLSIPSDSRQKLKLIYTLEQPFHFDIDLEILVQLQ